MAQPVIQTAFASGEWAPKLRSRVDISKYKVGAALMRNFFVDFAGGGASTRQGTEFLAPVGANGARLVPFQPSSDLSYVLEFGQNYIRFFSNGAQILSGGNPYQISSPYNAADLFPNQLTGNPGIKWVQNVTSLIICHPNYAPQILSINSPTNWTLSAISFGPAVALVTGAAATTTLGAGSWHYSYAITAVDNSGRESEISASGVAFIDAVLPLESTPGAISVFWNSVTGAVSYNVYKAFAHFGTAVIFGADMYGFVANQTSTIFIDSTPGIDPDMSQGLGFANNPFQGGSVNGVIVTVPGVYTVVPTIVFSDPPDGSTAQGYADLGLNTAVPASLRVNNPFAHNLVGMRMYFSNSVVLTVVTAALVSGTTYQINSVSITNGGNISVIGAAAPATGTPGGFSDGSVSYISGNVGLTWGVGSIYVSDNGWGYITPPTATFAPAGATVVTSIDVAGEPGVPGFFQERLVLAGQGQAPQSYNMSKPGDFFNFDYSFPSQDDDAISGNIIGEELNDIRSLVPVSTGIIALTGQGAWLINGGGGISTATPITPENQSAQTQAFNGATDVKPIKINLDIVYITNKGNYVRDFTYNVYANIYTGSDITTLSNHLFFGYQIVDWGWGEEPLKTLWAIRNDGVLLSLGYVKEQELVGWAHHDTNGQFLSICTVIENVGGNTVDAVYVIVQRLIGGNVVQYVERMQDRYFPYGAEDAWSVDCALQTAPQVSATSTLTITGDASAVGNSVTLSDAVGAPFTAPMAAGNWVVRGNGGVYRVTTFTSASQVNASVTRVPPVRNLYSGAAFPVTNGYTIWQPVSSVSGLTHLAGQTVVGVVDGAAVGPLTVSGGGGVTLGVTGTKITLGLPFTPQIKTLPLDLGEPTIQSKRKKLPAVTLRVADTLGLQVGTSFANLVAMKDFQLGAIPSQSNGVVQVTDLVNASGPDQIDGYQKLDQVWQEPGQLCIQQNLPYPATIIAVMPEVTVGDSK